MPNKVIVKDKINSFKKNILISGDKSLSIRWLLISSLAEGISTSKNLLMSEDVLATIKAIKKLGIQVKLKKKFVKFMAKELKVIITEKILLLMLKTQVL